MVEKTKPVGLYELIGEARNADLTSQDILNAIRPEMIEKDRTRLLAWAKEFEFWEEYAKIYWHMEDTGFYEQLAETIRGFIEPKEGEMWLDAGCGPAKMGQLIWEKSEGKVKKIIGIDIVLNPARETLVKLGSSIPLELQYANLGERLPFPDDFFDGIVANISLTYVIDFESKKGKAAFVEVMREMFRVLKPGTHIVWSTPKRNPFFWRNFLAGLPDMFSIRKQIQHRVFGLWIGMRILKYGLGIASKGRKGIYTFLEPKEYEKILRKIGFVNFEWKKTFAGQVWVNKAHKPSVV